MPKITPFLWFDTQAEQAATFYTSVFGARSKITSVSRRGSTEEGKPAPVMSITFELDGQPLMALNGGPHFQFSPAISFFVHCTTQDEVDHFWGALSEGGKIQQCGWLTDRFGVTWQIVPTILGELLQSGDGAKSQRVMQAMMKMVKLDIQGLQAAAAG